MASCGSSPRAWGRPGRFIVLYLGIRFIPTRVGQTPASTATRWSASVHPHARGADAMKAARDACCSRFIPTRVGQTVCAILIVFLLSVHPHARGADQGGFLAKARQVGSSPRAWGRRRGSGAAALPGRFIPTRVGQTFSRHAARRRGTVHPHARGADGRRDARRPGRNRFIPTRVGQTHTGSTRPG